MNLMKTLKNYKPKNEQESNDLKAMLSFIEKNDDYLERDNLIAHFTSSAIVMNENFDKVLFAHHNIYNSWSWVGGHNDGVEDCLEVAIKETKEETGLEKLKVFTEEIAGIDIIYVMPHIKKGKYISDHLHLNLTYILIADELDNLKIKPDENSGVKWINIKKLDEVVTEPRMIPIYKKIIHFAQKKYKAI